MQTLTSTVFLAQQSRLQEMGQHFQQGSQISADSGSVFIFFLSLVTLAAWLGYYYWKYQRSEGGFTSHSGLFRELCQTHALDRTEKKVLHQLTRWRHLSQPARIFLEQNHFEFDSLSPALQQQKNVLNILRNKLFGE